MTLAIVQSEVNFYRKYWNKKELPQKTTNIISRIFIKIYLC